MRPTRQIKGMGALSRIQGAMRGSIAVLSESLTWPAPVPLSVRKTAVYAKHRAPSRLAARGGGCDEKGGDGEGETGEAEGRNGNRVPFIKPVDAEKYLIHHEWLCTS